MRREDILKNFADATDEQIKALLDINSADIGNALNKQKGNLDTATAELAAANARIKELETTGGEVSALRKKVADFEEVDRKRREEAEAAAELAELTERFESVAGEREFLHEMVRKGVMADFEAALKDKAYKGKSDAEIFEALTKDKDYFRNQNPAGNMARINNGIGETDLDKLNDSEYYAKVFAKKT